jgi:peptidyl-prolyl cis-trans isomerase B (cyclophilin B)
MNKLNYLLIFATFLFAVNAQQTSKPVVKKNQRPVAKTSKPIVTEPFEKATVAEMSEQCVRLETESGNIELELFPETSPETVRNFLNLSAKGFYDTTTFSRIVSDFVIQGGSNSTRLKRSAAFDLRSQKKLLDEPSLIKHEPGILSMARTADQDSATTQFFILLSTAGNLDGTFSAFGRVTDGIDVVSKINKAKVVDEKPISPVRILKAVVFKCVEKK